MKKVNFLRRIGFDPWALEITAKANTPGKETNIKNKNTKLSPSGEEPQDCAKREEPYLVGNHWSSSKKYVKSALHRQPCQVLKWMELFGLQ